MKRLLRISFDTLLSTAMNIFIWIILSFIVDKSLINIYTLTFPIQYIGSSLKSIFGTGANISKEKGNKSDTYSGIIFGIVFSILIFGMLIYKIDFYMNIMNYSVNKVYVIYSMLELLLQTILNINLIKLYYEGENKLANKYSIIFYSLNLFGIVVTSLLINNSIYAIVITLLILLLFVIYIFIKNIKNIDKSKLNFNIKKWIRYDIVELTDYVLLGLCYFFGLSNTTNFGFEYTLAVTFIALITDTQWDVSEAIHTVAKIDISQNNFNYKYHFKNAYKLVLILIFSIFVLFISLYKFYDLTLSITLIFLSFHLADFILCPFYKINTYYLQLEYSAVVTVLINIGCLVIRFLLSFINNPYCTVIAQTTSAIFTIIGMNFLFYKYFKVNKNGLVERK